MKRYLVALLQSLNYTCSTGAFEFALNHQSVNCNPGLVHIVTDDYAFSLGQAIGFDGAATLKMPGKTQGLAGVGSDLGFGARNTVYFHELLGEVF